MSGKERTVGDRFRTGKAYTIRQAAALAKVSQGTVRNWLYGSTSVDGYQMEPVFGGKEKTGEVARVSFLELSELIIVARYRKLKLKLERIRSAHKFARSEFGVLYPFAYFDLTTIGGHVLRKFEQEHPDTGPHFVVLSAPDQYVLPGLVQGETERFEYSPDDKFAVRWFPYGKEVPIVVDPHFAGGRTTVAGRGVTIDIIKARFFKAHESIAAIARDFRLKHKDVEEVIRVRAA